MTFDNTLPADNRRWDLAAGDIRNNNDALEAVLGVDLDTDPFTATDVVAKGPDVDVRAFGALGGGNDDTVAVQAAIDLSITNGTHTLAPGDAYTTDALDTSDSMIESRNVLYSDARGLGETIDPADMSAAQPLAHSDGDFAYATRNSNITGNDVYSPIFPGIDHYDVSQSVCDIANESTIEHATAVAGYVKNLDPATNGVCLFGCGYVDADEGSIWGINTLLQDDAVRAAGTDTGRKLINELDFNVMHPDTEVIGLSIGGNSLSQPTTSTAFIANSLGIGVKWGTGFATIDGTCENAIGIAAASTAAANVSSQKIIFGVYDNTSASKVGILQAQSFDGVEYLVLDGATDKFNFKVSFGDVFLDAGQALSVGGNGVVTDRQSTSGETVGHAAVGGTNVSSSDTFTGGVGSTAYTLNDIVKHLKTHGLIAT